MRRFRITVSILCSLQRCLTVFLLIATILGIAVTGTAEDADSQCEIIRDLLRGRIEAANSMGHFDVGDERIYATVVLPRFYEQRGYLPAWISDTGPQESLDSLLEAIRAVILEGLNPEDYHLQEIERALTGACENHDSGLPPDLGVETDLELLATDAFLICGSHLLAGRVNPESINAEWFTKSRERDLAALLDTALTSGRVAPILRDLLPNHKGYFRLRNRLREFRQLAALGGWPVVPPGPTLRPGERDTRVSLLRRRLSGAGALAADVPMDTELYDKDLESEVISFQRRHGLDADGAVGEKTLSALNFPVDKRIEQIAANLERWRWLPEDLGSRYILVNIANFELDVVEADSTVNSMRVIVGRPYRRTPVFSDRMTYLVLNPYWNVPRNIALLDIVPQVRKSPDYLDKQQIKVMQGFGAEMRVIDPTTVNWATASSESFPYWFRQEPGPKNTLGRIKFMFPNQYNVYLHDTPAREKFAKTERGFSSGCIRIEDPIGLAEYVLTGDSTWTKSGILKALEHDTDRTVTLPRPLPVHLLYWTAWVTPDSAMQFRDDIYQRDSVLAQALAQPPPMAK